MPLVQILSYLTIIVFLSMVVRRFLKISNTPIHLRWELYPVPHEKGRAEYGGSRLEESNWWEKEHKADHLNEMFVMAKEIILLKGVWDHNKSLWYGSFPFHFAMYIVIVNMVIGIISALLLILGLSPGSIYFEIYNWVFLLLGFSGSLLGIIGSLRLLFSRIADKDLSKYSNMSHYFNIILIGAVFSSFLIWMLEKPYLSIEVLRFYRGLITLTAVPAFSTIGNIHMYIFLFFMFYMPFTHMTHFFTKYFTYHKVRWEDTAMNEKLKGKLIEQFNYKISWAAPHIGADGQKTWLTVATEDTKKEEKND